MLFIGLDLAWTPHNATGAALVRGDANGGELLSTALLGSMDEIVQFVAEAAPTGTPALVGVDAPLWVPNATGRRPGESELGAVFAKFQAGAHPANRGITAFRQGVRGEELVARLAAHGFTHDCAIAPGAPARQVIEVYPHSAMVALFGLPRTLKYKAKPRRSRETRMAAWAEYQRHQAALAAAEPPLRGQDAIVAHDVGALRGRALKDFEDRVDAVMCAYIVLYGFRWGAARCRTFGTMEGGYIYSPVPDLP
ncbi:hypothetical protein SE17_06850 [Kouleothrix aurantiaca]|uniref:DUF429 domain-containing protein n=1 Tax=Kouleothrix aurantiaca TaxID=186479 RepID=A0A0P9HGI9_9CHLR|nr:hypothetical protein SE17_06850 [Kouleothrix aurantiaca]